MSEYFSPCIDASMLFVSDATMYNDAKRISWPHGGQGYRPLEHKNAILITTKLFFERGFFLIQKVVTIEYVVRWILQYHAMVGHNRHHSELQHLKLNMKSVTYTFAI